MSPAEHDSQRPFSRTAIAGAIIALVFALTVVTLLRRPRQQADLIAQIKAVGGFVTHDPPPTLQERIAAFREGSALEANYTAVGLYLSDITGDWLTQHNDLTTLKITDLTLAETALTDADLARLIAAHPLEVVQLRAEKIGDQTVTALAGCQKLFMLQIRESPLDDKLLARLPLQQLEALRIDETAVTAAGLHELSRAQRLVRLAIDGHQLDQSAARMLSGLPALRELHLVGNAVTDDHLAMLHAISALESVTLDRTAVTEDGLKSLQSALPNCGIERR